MPVLHPCTLGESEIEARTSQSNIADRFSVLVCNNVERACACVSGVCVYAGDGLLTAGADGRPQIKLRLLPSAGQVQRAPGDQTIERNDPDSDEKTETNAHDEQRASKTARAAGSKAAAPAQTQSSFQVPTVLDRFLPTLIPGTRSVEITVGL